MPKVSIVVPVYNTDEKLLERCIESITRQTYVDFEAILVDDGSATKCAEILDHLAQQDSRLHVIHKSNGGVSCARNTGTDAAQGEFIVFVDSDDFIVPNWLSHAVEIATKENVDVVYGKVLITGECSDQKDSGKAQPGYRIYHQEDLWKIQCALFSDTTKGLEPLNINKGPYGKLFRLDAIKRIRFEAGVYYGEDQIFNHKVIETVQSIVLMDMVAYMYIYNAESVTKSFDSGRQKIVQKFLELIEKDLPDNDAIRNSFYTYCLMNLDNDVRAIYRNNGKKALSFRESVKRIRTAYGIPIFNRAKQEIKLSKVKPGRVFVRCLLVKTNIPVLLAAWDRK